MFDFELYHLFCFAAMAMFFVSWEQGHWCSLDIFIHFLLVLFWKLVIETLANG